MNIQTYVEETWNPGDKLKRYKVLNKEEAHNQGLLHLSTHLLVINDQGYILCRKRREDEPRYTGLFTTTIGTHVELGSDYLQTLEGLAPEGIEMRFAGEFRVKDDWENEINGLHIARCDMLPEEFMKDRYFLSPKGLERQIEKMMTTPHLREAYRSIEHGKRD